MFNKKIIYVLLFICISSILVAQKVIVNWNEVYSSFVNISNYPKKVYLNNFNTETLKKPIIFYKNDKKDYVYNNGYISFSFDENENAIINVYNVKNWKPEQKNKKKYFLGVKESKILIRERKDEDWSSLKIQLIKELKNPYADLYEYVVYDKIWIVQFQSKYFTGEYVLMVCSGDFPVKD